MYLSNGKASLILGVSISTLRAWERASRALPANRFAPSCLSLRALDPVRRKTFFPFVSACELRVAIQLTYVFHR